MMKAALFSPIVAVLTIIGSVTLPSARAEVLPLNAVKEREAKIQKVIERCLPCVVAITTEKPSGTGSGVIVSRDGLIYTAAHVTKATGPDLVIIFPDGRRVKGKALGGDRSCDAALAKITEPGDYPFVDLGQSDTLKLGDWCVALGQPGGFDPKRQPPARIGRIWKRDGYGALFTDCPLIGGDSGGPLFDLDGKLIGIHSSIGGTLAINRHVGIDNFRSDLDRMMKGDTWGRLALGEDEPERPVLGLELDEDSQKGVTVKDVREHGPAATAGLKQGDVITHIGGEELQNYLSYVRIMTRKKPGDVLKLIVKRGESKLDMEVKLASRTSVERGHATPPSFDTPPEPDAWLGVEIAGGTDKDGKPKGAKITGVALDGPAGKAGLQVNDVVVKFNGTNVKDHLQLAEWAGALKPGEKIKLGCLRGDAEQEIEVTLSSRPPAKLDKSAEPAPAKPAEAPKAGKPAEPAPAPKPAEPAAPAKPAETPPAPKADKPAEPAPAPKPAEPAAPAKP